MDAGKCISSLCTASFAVGAFVHVMRQLARPPDFEIQPGSRGQASVRNWAQEFGDAADPLRRLPASWRDADRSDTVNVQSRACFAQPVGQLVVPLVPPLGEERHGSHDKANGEASPMTRAVIYIGLRPTAPRHRA